MSSARHDKPTTPDPEIDGAVFVDPTGRRGRRWALVGIALTIVLLAYLGMLGLALVTSTGPAGS